MKRSWPPFEDLVRNLEDVNRHVRSRSAQGLGESRDPRAVEPLLRALADPAGDVRARAAVALGRLRDPRAIGPLIAAMRDDKVSVRTGAAAAVKKFGKQAYQPLLEVYRGASGGFRTALLGAVAHFKTPAVSELLIAALDDPDRNRPLEAIRLLGRRKARRAVERLLVALADARSGLDRAIRAWKEPQAGDSPAFQPSTELTEWAEIAPRLECIVWALGEIGDARAFAPLQELLELEIDESRVHHWIVLDVVTALRKIDNLRAVDLLHRLLDDPTRAGRDWLAMILAGMDLMNATESLRVSARGGNLGVLWQALRAAGGAHDQLFSQEWSSIQNTAVDGGETSGFGTDLIRRLEWVLRGLSRDQRET